MKPDFATQLMLMDFACGLCNAINANGFCIVHAPSRVECRLVPAIGQRGSAPTTSCALVARKLVGPVTFCAVPFGLMLE